jgi:hypothetical protein
MKIPAPHGYVTHKNWVVSVGTTVPSEPAILNVSRYWKPGRSSWRGDADSRAFPNRDAAWEYAQSHGYVEAYRRADRATWKRVNRVVCVVLAQAMVEEVRAAKTRKDIIRIGDAVRATARQTGCELLDSAMFSLAAHTIAQRLRPELYAR